MDLATFITKSECESLNEADDHPLAHALTSGGGFLASDCDEQLIINITFNQVNQNLHTQAMLARVIMIWMFTYSIVL